MKHLIKIQTVEHGTLSCIHGGRDGQYAEAGTTIVLDWQPSAGWGLQEAHIIDGAGNVTQINLAAKTFTMPDSPITIVGTFKRFGVQDWTEGHNPHVGAAFVVGINGEPVAQGGNLISIGSFPNNELPTLNGFEDAGKLAYSTTLRQYLVWDGYGWTYMDGTPIAPRYLRVVSSQPFGFGVVKDAGTLFVPSEWNLEYSTDGGRGWNTYTIKDLNEATELHGDVLFRGVNPGGFYAVNGANKVFLNFFCDGETNMSGDITSMLNGFGGDFELPASCFYSMFATNEYLVTPPNLPSTKIGASCYEKMFYNSTALRSAPELPATSVASRSYYSMFEGCIALEDAPSLPATILSLRCYYTMFKGCALLEKAPSLPAMALSSQCYRGMFEGCTGLVEVPFLPAADLASNCYQEMFKGCSGVPSYHFATLNASSNIFTSNTACAEFTIDAEEPPAIGGATLTGLKASCIIYVPAASVDAYKASDNWIDRAQYIQAKP